MSNPNKHIENYLNEYLKMKIPGFAVMISGTWGCGKTYFIKEYIKDNAAKKICYISLYGVKDTDEIDRRIFLALHPKLNGDYTDLVTHTFNGALTLINGDKVLEKLKFKDFIHATKGCTLVFDDLERCSLAKKDVMGYINGFVEHKKNHVVVIANEEEIPTKELTEDADIKERSAYNRVKEKLIGKTFTMDSDIRTVLPSIIKVVDNPACFNILLANQPLLINIFNAAYETYREHNYRAFTNTLRDFEWFLSNLDPQYVKHENLMRDLLPFFVSVGYEIQLGKLSAKDILDQQDYFAIAVTKTAEHKEIKIETLLQRNSISADSLILDKKLWARTFENKAVLKKDLNEALANSVYFYTEKKPADYIRLWHWRDQEDEEAMATVQTVRDGLANYKYTIPGEILHIFGCFLKLSTLKVISESNKDVQEMAEKYIGHLTDTDKLDVRVEGRDLNDLLFFGHGNLGYASENTDEFKAIGELLIEKIKEANRNRKVRELPNILKELAANTQEVCDRLALGDLRGVDVLKEIDPSEFLKAFLKIPNKNKREVAFMLKNRYEHVSPSFNSVLQNEHHFLIKLDELIADKLSNAETFTPTMEQLKLTKDAYLAPAIKRTLPLDKPETAESARDPETKESKTENQ